MNIYNFLKDYFIPKKIVYIQDQNSLHNILEDIKSKKLLAIDTEFTWRNTYFPELNLIQISTENKIYILDCGYLNILDLQEVFADESITKIFHSIRGDLSVLYNSLGIKVFNIFDTQIAEDLLNKNEGLQVSYKNLVKKYILRDISKSETNSNWQKRPLTDKQIDYAAEDVRYLHTIMRIQKKRLSKLKKLDFFYSLCNREKDLGEEYFSKSRLRRFLKKNKNISKEEVKIFNWRENEAEKLNVPPSHILEDRDIKRLKKTLVNKKYDEFRWIIKKESSRKGFIENFT